MALGTADARPLVVVGEVDGWEQAGEFLCDSAVAQAVGVHDLGSPRQQFVGEPTIWGVAGAPNRCVGAVVENAADGFPPLGENREFDAGSTQQR